MTQSGPAANAAQSKLWNSTGGEVWVEQQALLDRLFAPFEAVIVEVVRAAGAREVLDVGCGAGATTLAVARSLGAHCVGADISRPLIEAARRRAADLDVEFVVADAQQHAFEPGRFDALVSRFGVMFFDDPVAAFANMRRASRPGASLNFIAWRGVDDNPAMVVAERAAAPFLPQPPRRDPAGPGQFGFADPDRVHAILDESGWREADIQPLDVPCVMPLADLEAYLTRMGPIGQVLPSLDEALRASVTAAVRRAFDVYVRDGAARFNAACWMIRARNLA